MDSPLSSRDARRLRLVKAHDRAAKADDVVNRDAYRRQVIEAFVQDINDFEAAGDVGTAAHLKALATEHWGVTFDGDDPREHGGRSLIGMDQF